MRRLTAVVVGGGVGCLFVGAGWADYVDAAPETAHVWSGVHTLLVGNCRSTAEGTHTHVRARRIIAAAVVHVAGTSGDRNIASSHSPHRHVAVARQIARWAASCSHPPTVRFPIRFLALKAAAHNAFVLVPVQCY